MIPKSVLEPTHPAMNQPNGPIVDNKPFKISLKAGNWNEEKIETIFGFDLIAFERIEFKSNR